MALDTQVAVIGAGVTGSASALALARRGTSVALLEAETEPGLAASGTNSGIIHTGFDSVPGELETELILRSAVLRRGLLERLGVPWLPCGAVMTPRGSEERRAVQALAANAKVNGVEVALNDQGGLSIPCEGVTDPVAYTLALAAAAQRHGAQLLTRAKVVTLAGDHEGLQVELAGGERLRAQAAVNCAGLHADAVAGLVGETSFAVYPRKGEFLVFDPAAVGRLEHILLPVPSPGTKGVLVFPAVDGSVIAGPTAVDETDKEDWSVRPQAREEILAKAAALHPPLAGAEPVAAYAGLRPAGRGVNYWIASSRTCPRLINVAAIRSTGLSASLGIAERVCGLVATAGVRLGPERALEAGPAPRPTPDPWWRRTAAYRATPSS